MNTEKNARAAFMVKKQPKDRQPHFVREYICNLSQYLCLLKLEIFLFSATNFVALHENLLELAIA